MNASESKVMLYSRYENLGRINVKFGELLRKGDSLKYLQRKSEEYEAWRSLKFCVDKRLRGLGLAAYV